MRLKNILHILFLFFFLPLYGQVGLVETRIIDSLNMAAKEDSISSAEQIRVGEKALNLSMAADYQRGIYESYLNIGLGYLDLSNYSEALDNFQKASLSAAELKDAERQAKASYFIGNVHLYLENLEQALIAHEEAFQLYQSQNNKAWMGAIKNGIGVILSKQGKGKESLKTYEEALDILSGDSLELTASFPLANIGDYYLNEEKPAEAIPYFEKVLDVYRREKYYKGEAVTLENLGIAHSGLGNFEIAFEYFDQGLAIAKKHQFNQVIYESYEDIANAFKAQNEPEKALEYYQKYYTLKDSIVNAEKNTRIANLWVLYEIEKKEIELERSQEEMLQKEKISDLMNIFLGGGFLVLVLVGFLIYSRSKVKQELVESELKNKQLESQRLKEELEFKQKDLTNFALDISRKNEFSNKILESLRVIHKSQDFEFRKKEIRNLLMLTSNHLKINEDIKEFQMNVEKVNQDFFNKLDQNFPELTINEKQLCGLIRLNLSTKDIASIRNISPKSVEMGRYRLRKKLNLAPKEELSAFLRRL